MHIKTGQFVLALMCLSCCDSHCTFGLVEKEQQIKLGVFLHKCSKLVSFACAMSYPAGMQDSVCL